MTEEDWVEYGEYRRAATRDERKKISAAEDDVYQTYKQLSELDNTDEEVRQGLYFKFVLGYDIISKYNKYQIDRFLKNRQLTPQQQYENILSDILTDIKTAPTFHRHIQEMGILQLADLLEKMK